MAQESLKGLNVAILVTDGFEQVELTEPRTALDEAGAKTQIISPKNEHVRAWKFTDWGIELPVDVKLNDAQPEDFDALLLPGGVINPDTLRIEPRPYPSSKPSLMMASRSLRFATDPGPSSRPARRAAGASPRGLR